MNRIPLPEAPSLHLIVEFEPADGHADRVHLLEVAEIHAVNAAIAAGRPLLVRGEPGCGKSQLARAAAKQLGRAFIPHVIDSHTESRDLLWSFDAVKRLADAQLAGALHKDTAQAESRLAVENYLHPGPLWWAFDWDTAKGQADKVGAAVPLGRDGGDPRQGSVLLLDEIDKAESEVPNGLLEALGAREFTPQGRTAPVRAIGTPPLVVITSNEERALPDAFLRRCMVLYLKLPKSEPELISFLVARGERHFENAPKETLREAAEMLSADRQSAIAAQVLPRPGQAEYLDLLRAVLNLAPGDIEEQKKMLRIVAQYTLKKSAGSGAMA